LFRVISADSVEINLKEEQAEEFIEQLRQKRFGVGRILSEEDRERNGMLERALSRLSEVRLKNADVCVGQAVFSKGLDWVNCLFCLQILST
jgi:hypothetical protein